MDYLELANKITQKQLNEGTTSFDNSVPVLKIGDVMYRLYTAPLISELGSCLPVTKPSGVTFGLCRDYDPVSGAAGEVKKNYASTRENEAVNKCKFNLMSKPIFFQTKKIASQWTLEAVQDFIKMHTDSKSEEELSQILARELTNEMILELDAEAVDYMVNAARKENWKFQDTQRSLQVWELLEKITECGLEMLQLCSYRSRINVFCSKKIAAKLSTHPTFERPSRDMNKTKSIYLVGSIGNVDIFADVYGYLEEDYNKDYILVTLKDPDPNGLSSSIMYFPYADAIYSAPAQDGSSDIIFYNIFRYGVSLNPTTSNEANTNDMLRFICIEYGEGDPTLVPNKDFFIGQIPTNEGWFNTYDLDPENYDFTDDIENNLGNLQQFVFEDVMRAGNFTFSIDNPGNFVFFIVEQDKELWMNTSKDFYQLSSYLTDPKEYTITKDLGSGMKTYKVIVNNTEIHSIPDKIYIRTSPFA